MQIEQMEGKIIELGPEFNYEKSSPEIQTIKSKGGLILMSTLNLKIHRLSLSPI